MSYNFNLESHNDENFWGEEPSQDNLFTSQERVNFVLSKSNSTMKKIRKPHINKSQDQVDFSKFIKRDVTTPKRKIMKNSERKNRKLSVLRLVTFFG